MEPIAGADIHALTRQMGTSLAMLERHCSELMEAMALGILVKQHI